MANLQHDATQSYTNSGFNTKMGWGERPALLIIDVCKAYWDKSSPLDISSNPAAAASPDAMRQLLSAARSSGTPVIWTQVSYTDPSMADAGLFWHKAKVLDVWQKGDTRGLDACLKGLSPEQGEAVVIKKYASGFFGTTLFTELQVCYEIHSAKGHRLLTAVDPKRGHCCAMRCVDEWLCASHDLGCNAIWIQAHGTFAVKVNLISKC